MDFNGGKVSDRSGLGAVRLLRGAPTAEDAAAGLVKAFTAEFGHLDPASLGRSRAACGVSRKDPPLPAVPGGRGSGQGYGGGRAESTGSPPAVQAQIEGLAVTLSLTLNCTQMTMMWSRDRSQTMNSE